LTVRGAGATAGSLFDCPSTSDIGANNAMDATAIAARRNFCMFGIPYRQA
jgi:hypothetical protein